MTIRTNIFPKMFCSLCGGECPSTANFSIKAASSVDKEKLLKEYFHREYPQAALIVICAQVTAVADVLKSCGAFYR